MIDFNYRDTLILAILVLFLGKFLTRKIDFLQNNNIPEPVTGGVLASLLVTAIYLLFDISFEFALEQRDALLIVFYTTIGLSTHFKTLIEGGKSLVLLLLITITFLFIQNFTGILSVEAAGLPPEIGLVAGSVSLSGGHGTTIAWAPVFVEDYGLEQARDFGLTVATFGLILGGVLGGPIARFLINRYQLQSASNEPIEVGFKYEERHQKIDVDSMLKTILVVAVTVGIGIRINDLLALWGMALPLFVSCLFAGIIVTNTVPWVFPRFACPSGTPTLALVSDLSLGLFLAMSMMSLKLLALPDLAGLIAFILLAQVVVAALFVVLVVFRAMGKSYEAAVMSSGFIGLCLGATPTAIANMTAVTKKFGAAPKAFIVIPIIGAFFVDVSNAVVIKTILGWMN